MTETNSTPTNSSADSTSTPAPAVQTPFETGAATEPRPARRSRTRTALIAGGATLAALILAGGGVAVGAAIADDFEGADEDETVQTVDEVEEDAADDTADAVSAPYGAESADEVLAIIDAASGTAEGDVVGIDADQDGSWEVQLRRGTGDETEVRVDANGVATIASTEPAESDDVAPSGVLDSDTVEALVRAALAEEEGTIIDIEVDDQVAPYDVSVLTDDKRTVTLELGADFAVVTTGSED